MRFGRRPQRLTSYRAVLARRGDIELNAYARHWRRNVLGVILAVALAGGAVWLYYHLHPRGEIPNPAYRQFTDRVRCEVCGHEAQVQVSTRDKFPLTCPKCKAHSCWEVWRCQDCGTEFLRKPLVRPGRGEPDTAATVVHCPNCGSSSVGAAPAPAAGSKTRP